MNDLKAYWRGDRSIESRVAYAKYCRESRLRRARKEVTLVDSDWARIQLSLFPNKRKAAKLAGVGESTVQRIFQGKKIRIETERRILAE